MSQGKFACCSKSSRNIERKNCGQTHITAGHVSQEQVIRYIAEQDKALKDVKPFSYSIFDKRQKTLADFLVS